MNLQTSILAHLDDLKGTVLFQGLKVRIENPVGSTRSGKGWSVTMTYPYGEIVGTDGVDGDPVDCFLGSDHTAKFVYVIHTLGKDGSFDEDKCMLGFTTPESAKAAFMGNYSSPTFFGSMDTFSLEDFKAKLKATRKDPQLLRAAGILSVGDEVKVDGRRDKGVVLERNGRMLTIDMGRRVILVREETAVHPWEEGHVSSMWKG